MADIQPEKIKWFWPHWLALGKLALIAGGPGIGKSRKLSKLQETAGQRHIRFQMADGTVKTIPKVMFLPVVCDAMLGKYSPGSDIILASVADNSGGRIAELLRAVVLEPDEEVFG